MHYHHLVVLLEILSQHQPSHHSECVGYPGGQLATLPEPELVQASEHSMLPHRAFSLHS